MDHSRIIRGAVGGGRYTVTAPITQWDYGYLFLPEIDDLPATYRLDFSNDEHHGTAYAVYGNSEGAEVPEDLIDTGKDVFVWYFYVGDGYGKSEYKWRIPNKCKPKTSEDEPTPSQQSSIDQLIIRSNEAVESAEQSAQTAHEYAQASASNAESASASAQSADASREAADESEYNAQVYAENAQASATASAQSAEQSAINSADAQDSAEEAQGYANEAKGYATQASNYADDAQGHANTAHGYATSASESAGTATSKATEASGYAQTASQKATEASGYADTSSQKATESAQSASQALTYKTDAETAKTSAQTAQGLAESARDDAIDAKTDAESARDEAQNIVDGISAKAEQIDQNTADIASLEEDRYKPYAVDTASGAVASFSDGADNIPLKSLIVNIDPVQDTSSGDPSPENICPISGWEGCEVKATGYNIWDEEWEVGGLAYGNPNANTSRIRSKNYIPCKPNTTYYFSKGINNGNMWVFFYDRNKACLNPTTNGDNVSNSAGVVTTPDKCYYIRFFLSAQTEYQHDVTINYPSTDHDYHPYVGRSIPISWQTEAGTVYGGKLDVLSGVLTVEWAKIDLSTLSGWANNMTGDKGIEIRCALNGKKEGRTNIISDKLLTETETSATNTAVYSVRGFPTSSLIAVKAPTADVTNSNGLVAWIGENKPSVCYELAEPITYQLTPQQVNSLLGQNNIFADTGDASVEYRADTKLYIEKLTEPDADMIADANIVSGQYFMVGNSLFKATANIASGSAVIVGTNAIRKSLSEALNEINA